MYTNVYKFIIITTVFHIIIFHYKRIKSYFKIDFVQEHYGYYKKLKYKFM